MLDVNDDNNNSLNEKAFNNLMVDLPTLLSKASSNGFGLLNYPGQLLGFGQLSADNNNNNPSLINGSVAAAAAAVAAGAGQLTGANHTAHNLLLAAAKSSLTNGASNGNSTRSSPLPVHNMMKSSTSHKQPKVSNSKKIWSCGKCSTCLQEDCGTCIYCLDRPKFGGPFIKKQRCIKRRCLMKVKNKGTGPVDPVVNGESSTNGLNCFSFIN